MHKWIIFSFYEDEKQIVIDVVPARTLKSATLRVAKARPDAIIDGGGLLKRHVAGLQATLAEPMATTIENWNQLCKEI